MAETDQILDEVDEKLETWEPTDEKSLSLLRAAVGRVRAWYPEDLFPAEVDEGKTEAHRRSRAAAKMARLTCDNILEVAREMAE